MQLISQFSQEDVVHNALEPCAQRSWVHFVCSGKRNSAQKDARRESHDSARLAGTFACKHAIKRRALSEWTLCTIRNQAVRIFQSEDKTVLNSQEFSMPL